MLAHFNRRLGLSLVGAFTLLMALVSPAAASPGDLDPTFDGDGKVTTFAGIERVNAVAIQADGKIVVAGCTACFSGSDAFALARYNTDGSLDATFGGDGRVTADFTGAAVASAVAIQADGKIVAAGGTIVSGNADFALARYNTDGSLDTTFDGDGKVTTDFAADSDQARGVAIQGDGKIVAAGSAFVGGIGDFALARYNTDGSLDTTLDGDGRVTTDFAGVEDSASAVAIQGNQKIVVAGCTSCFPSGSDFALARYNTDGSLDLIFSGDGKVTTDFAAGQDVANGVAIQADGKIVAAGVAITGVGDFALARYTVCRRTSRPTSVPFCP